MNPESTFRRVTQAATGVAFLLLGVLVASGFGGFARYGAAVRWIVAGLIVLYGVIRLRGAWSRRAGGGQNWLD
jgi:hypothetical protein